MSTKTRGRNQIKARVDDSIRDLIEERARRDGVDRSTIVRQALSEHLGVEVA
ncbi:MAG: ribbon-helix-helix protein, CopG family [Acidimicrobiales bacterium]